MTLLYSVPSAYAALVADRGNGHAGLLRLRTRRRVGRRGHARRTRRAGHRAARRARPGTDRLHRGRPRLLRQQPRPQPPRHGRPPGPRLRGGAARPRRAPGAPDGAGRGRTVGARADGDARLPEPARGDRPHPGRRLARHPGPGAPRTGRHATGTWAGPTTWRWSAASPSPRWRWRRCCAPTRRCGRSPSPPSPTSRGATRLRAFVVARRHRPHGDSGLRGRTRSAWPATRLAAFKVPRTRQLRPRRCPAPRPASSAATSSARAPGDRRHPAPATPRPHANDRTACRQSQPLLADRGFYLGPMFRQAAARHGAVSVTLDRPLDVSPELGPRPQLHRYWPIWSTSCPAGCGRPGCGPRSEVVVHKTDNVDIVLLTCAVSRIGAVPALLSPGLAGAGRRPSCSTGCTGPG